MRHSDWYLNLVLGLRSFSQVSREQSLSLGKAVKLHTIYVCSSFLCNIPLGHSLTSPQWLLQIRGRWETRLGFPTWKSWLCINQRFLPKDEALPSHGDSFYFSPWNRPITSWQIDGETMETMTHFILRGSKICAGGDCSHKIKRHLLPGRKAMTNLDNILKAETLLCQQRSV